MVGRISRRGGGRACGVGPEDLVRRIRDVHRGVQVKSKRVEAGTAMILSSIAPHSS